MMWQPMFLHKCCVGQSGARRWRTWLLATALTTLGASQALAQTTPAGMLSARDLGVPGDGTTLATANFVGAVVAAAKAGKCLFLPNGVYLLDEARIPPATPNPCIVGESVAGTILRRVPQAAHVPVLSVERTTGAHLSTFQIDGNRAMQSRAGYNLVATDVSGLQIDNVISHDSKAVDGGGSGFRFTTTDAPAASSVSNFQAYDNDSDGVTIGPVAHNLSLHGGTARNNGDIGIKVSNLAFPPAPGTLTALQLTDIEASSNRRGGIVVLGFYTGGKMGRPIVGPGAEEADNVTIARVKVLHNENYGLVVQAAHATVSDVVASYNGDPHGGTAGLLANAEESTFTNITVEHNHLWGIDAGACYHCTFDHIEAGYNDGDGIGLGSGHETTLTNAHAYLNGAYQIAATNYDFGGGSGFPYPAILRVSGCTVEAKPGRIGVFFDQNATVDISNCRVSGTSDDKAYVFRSNNVRVSNLHTQATPAAYVAPRPASGVVVVPDWVENVTLPALPGGRLDDIRLNFEQEMHQQVFAISPPAAQVPERRFPMWGSGAGYSKAKMRFGPGCAKNPEGDVYVNGGVVVGVQLHRFGEGCTTAPAVTVEGDGSGAVVTATVASGAARNARRLRVTFLADTTIMPSKGIVTPGRAPMAVRAGTAVQFVGQNGAWSVSAP